MPFPLSPVDAILQQASLKYKNPDRMKRDVKAALEHYQGLKLKFEDFVFNNGTTMKLLNLDGVIPVTFNNVRYNIPVIIWLLDTHPNNPPMCFVKPTSDMHIKPSRHVDLNGKIYLPFLHDWNPSMSDLFGLIQVMIVVFGEEPPVYSKPKSSQPTQPQPPVAGLPYPNSTPGYYPMPGVPGQGLAYPPYPSGTAGIPPPYPSLFPTSQPPASQPTYPPYPISNPSTSTPYPVSTQAQATPASLGMNAGNTGTIKEAHIKASLLSAVEEKVMRRVAQIEAQYQDEMKVLHQTQMDLNNGKTKLEELMKRLEFEESPPSLASRNVESFNSSLQMVGVMHGQEFSSRSLNGLEFCR
ncbi:unnamed protein product [Darwinula stevensoni]|uniref:UEV domain-containing protein n=1 Tax=Darwinula stevensoni TaxID=69355 RepID=A0A7R9A4B8_9CRUS|nr:unnamed protein product [Darwinula stevensoni]CAG0893301.1 unnamed protein product [Darwinula stevensoni]